MVRSANEHLQVPSPVIACALASGFKKVKLEWLFDELNLLARQENALALRLAMVLACIKQLDVSAMGYAGFLPFCRERVQWGQAWVRAMVRLVESPLDRVKAAVAAGHLPLRLAVNAPGRISVEEQARWLGEASLGEVGPRPTAGHASTRRVWRGRDAEIIRQARELAQVCMGRPASLTELDAYILRHWRQHVPGAALEEGRATPPAPEARALDFDWVNEAPAEGLLGPWEEPANLDEAVAQLEAVEAVRRGRVATLARVFAVVHHHALWRQGNFDSPWDFAERVLGWSRRTAQRYRKLGWALDGYPELDHAVREGFSPEGASAIGSLAHNKRECRRWLELARHLGQQELKRATACWGVRLGDYERALRIARRNAAELLDPQGPTSKPSGTVPVCHIGQADPLDACSQACEEDSRAGVPTAGTPVFMGATTSCAGTYEPEVGEPRAGTPSSGGAAIGAGTPGSTGASSCAGTPGSEGTATSAGTPGSEGAATSAGTAGSTSGTTSAGTPGSPATATSAGTPGSPDDATSAGTSSSEGSATCAGTPSATGSATCPGALASACSVPDVGTVDSAGFAPDAAIAVSTRAATCAGLSGSPGAATSAGTPGWEGTATCAGTPSSEGSATGAGIPGSPATATSAGTPGSPDDATSAGTSSSEGSATCAGTPGSEGAAPGDAATIRVALPLPEPRPVDFLRGHVDLAEAARWFVAHNPWPKTSGFAAVKERARFRCQNPECGRPTLRLEAHHVHWLRYGGSDEPENAVALCRCCHLRGVHTADERIRVTRVIVEGLEALLWEYPGRAPVLQFREVPPR